MILNFLDPGQVPLILSGEKTQTTIPRGPVCLREGDVLQACSFAAGVRFGQVKIIGVTSHVGRFTFENVSAQARENWARREGFKDFTTANRWFSRTHGPDWMKKHFDILEFRGAWLRED